MFTEPRILRAAQAMYDCDLQQLLDLAVLPDPILSDHEIWDYLQPTSCFDEVQS
ncbi:hypothetical protein [uncultured Tateyamaria sp.]|uniref:hypothetical protein n=1 Tax=uncultured Tateyamaria sp. TaxID=455651 RepID=UPI0026193303|nr:hypothetical protein [uncultured Tateyamaria sp.]